MNLNLNIWYIIIKDTDNKVNAATRFISQTLTQFTLYSCAFKRLAFSLTAKQMVYLFIYIIYFFLSKT